MRLVVLAVVVVACAIAAAAAHACSCVAPQTPRQDLGSADAAFYGTVVTRDVVDEGSPDVEGDEYVNYTFRIDVDYKQNLPEQLLLGFPVASVACGMDLDVGDEIGILLDRFQGQFLASACSVRSKAFLDSGIASLPDPLAVPPPRFLAAGGFGAPRVAGLDADGRLVKYGGGPGSVSDVSVCPGGVTAVETVQNLDGIRDGLALRDLESLDQQATRFLGLRRTGARYETIDDVQCLTRDASRISVFLADTGTGVARLLLLRGQRKDPVWVGRASVATYRGQRVWLDGPAGMRAVHVRSGEERVLGLLPLTGRPLGLSPDGETLAAGVDGTLQLIDTATGAVLGVRRGEPNELAWIDNGRLVTRRKGRTRLLDRRGQVVADDLPPGALTVSDGQLVIIEGDRLARYSRLGIVLSRSQQLFSDGITVLTGLPSRSARIACLNLRRQRWEQH